MALSIFRRSVLQVRRTLSMVQSRFTAINFVKKDAAGITAGADHFIANEFFEANGYAHWKLITNDNSYVSGGADIANGDFLYSVTDDDLRTVANGGFVEHSSGYDIRFETPGGTKLSHKIIYYDGATGTLKCLIKVPLLTYASATTFKIFFGNPLITASEEAPTTTFNANYKGVWPISESPDNGISLDATSSGRGSSGDISFSHTIGVGENTVIYILTSAQDSNHANLPIDDVTVGGVRAQKIRHDEATGNNRTEIWRLINPPTGTKTIAVSATGNIGELSAFAISLFGADQTDPDDADNGATGSSSGPSVAITPLTDLSWILSVCSAEDTFSSNGTGQTTIATLTDQSFENARATYEGPKSPSSDTQSFVIASGQSWAMSSVAVRPAAQIKDVTSNRYHMTSFGTMTSADLITGPIHKAIEFDGSDDYLINKAWLSVIDGNDARTISAWFKIPGLNTRNWIAWGEAGTSQLCSMSDYAGQIGFTGYANDHTYDGSAYDDDQWHKMSITFDGSTIKVIIDGVERVSASTTLSTSANDDLYFGRWLLGSYMIGALAMIRISDVCRTNGYEITQYNSEKYPSLFWSTGPLDGIPVTTTTQTMTMKGRVKSAGTTKTMSMKAAIALSGGSEYLIPNGNNSNTGWGAEGGPDYTSVDDPVATPDDGTTKIYTPTANDTFDVTLTDSAITTETITAVTVVLRVFPLDPVTNTVQAYVKIGGTNYYSSNLTFNDNTQYQDVEYTWTVNPATSAAWTASELDALIIGIKKIDSNGSRCTQMYAKVDYTSGSTTTYDVTMTMKARVKKTVTQTMTAKARVKGAGVTQTMTMRARVKKAAVTATTTLKARVKKTVTQTSTMKARVKGAGVTQTVTMKARVKQVSRSSTVTMKSRIKQIIAQTMTMKAYINAAVATITSTMTMKSRVKTSGTVKTVSMKSRVKRLSESSSVTMKSRIKKQAVSSSIQLKSRIKTSGTTATISLKARVKKLAVTSSIDIKSRIKKSSVESMISMKSRVKSVGTTKTISMKARVKKTLSSELYLRARVLYNRNTSVAMKARVRGLGITATISLQARVKQPSQTKTISFKASIFNIGRLKFYKLFNLSHQSRKTSRMSNFTDQRLTDPTVGKYTNRPVQFK